MEEKWSIEDFGGSETTQYVLQWWIHVVTHLCKLQCIEYVTPRVNSNVNCELQMIMIYRCRFTDCNKCTILVGVVENGGGCTCAGAGDLWEFPYCLLNFAVNAKLL